MLVYGIAPRSLLSEVILAGPYKPPPFTLSNRYLSDSPHYVTSYIGLLFIVSPAPALTVESKLHERKDTVYFLHASPGAQHTVGAQLLVE